MPEPMSPEFPNSQSLPTDPPGAMRGKDFFPKGGEYLNFENEDTIKPPDQGEIPPWMWGEQSGFVDRESKLAVGYQQVKFVSLLVELGDLQNQDTREEFTARFEARRKKLKQNTTDEDKEVFLEQKETEITAELDRYMKMAIGSGQDYVIGVANMIERLTEPSDYVVQEETRFFETADKGLLALARYFKQEIPEKVVPWFRRFDESLTQQQGILSVLRAAGAAAPGYYDAIKQVGETLIDRMRFHANAGDFRSAYGLKDAGVTVDLTDSQKAEIKGTFAEFEPRKEQQRMINDARLFIDATSAVAQTDIVDGVKFRNEVGKVERVEIPMELSEKKVRFIKLLWGDLTESKWVVFKSKGWDGKEREIKIPKEIEMWYADSDNFGVREKWLSKMIAAVEWKDKNSKLGLWDSIDKMTPDQILTVAQEIDKKAIDIKTKIGDKIELSKFERGASKLAILQWLETDKTLMKSSELSWKFYYKEINGAIRRFRKEGGIYKAYDSKNAKNPLDKYLGYKAGMKSTSQFFIASSDAMRKEKMLHRPDWMPPLEPALKNDWRMEKIWNSLFDPKMKNFRARILAGVLNDQELQKKNIENALKVADLDPAIAEDLMKNTYAYETAYVTKDGKNIVYPMSIPNDMEFVSFWNNVWIGDESIGQKLKRGEKMSKIDFSQINFEELDKFWVNGSMMVRLLKFWIDPYDKQRDPVLAAFFASAGTQSESEMGKRIFLMMRGVPNEYKKMFAKIMPDMIALYEAHDCGLLGTELGTTGGGEKILEKWNFRIANWIRAFKWQPNIFYDDPEIMYLSKSEILTSDSSNFDSWDGIKNIGNDLALILAIKKLAIERVAQGAFAADKDELTRVHNGLLAIYDDPDMKDVFTPEGKEASVDAKTQNVSKRNFAFDPESKVEASLFDKR